MNKETLSILEDQVSAIIKQNVDLIVINAKSLGEARERSARFLVAQSTLSTFLKNFEDDLAKSSTMTKVRYAEGISKIAGDKITEKKAQVETDTDYTSAREAEQTLEAFKDWIKTHMKIFENAHLMFRQYARE